MGLSEKLFRKERRDVRLLPVSWLSRFWQPCRCSHAPNDPFPCPIAATEGVIKVAWDSRNGNLFVADIGQNIVEEVSLVTKGANLGWNKWEGSFGFISRANSRNNQI
jgi:hypothetical protein